MVEIMLSNSNFSNFFTDADRYMNVKESLNESLFALHQIKADTEDQKVSLLEKQTAEAELKRAQEFEKLTIEEQEARKAEILAETRGEEAAYQELLEAQQKTAAQLRAQLFALLGGGGPIPFPEAVQLAQSASSLTGVPAALILAILEQESAYGSNIGGCTMGDVAAGRDIMHPTRDKPIFLVIGATFGFDPATQQCRVHCAGLTGRESVSGAMGPSQFIPSTWAIFSGYVASGGHTYVASRDSIKAYLVKPHRVVLQQPRRLVATALLLRDNGATGSYYADRTATLRYYAGGVEPAIPERLYGDGVINEKRASKERLER